MRQHPVARRGGGERPDDGDGRQARHNADAPPQSPALRNGCRPLTF
jgi:hypothetical protein